VVAKVTICIADFRENNTDRNGITEAYGLAEPHDKYALVILSDDDPSNDVIGYTNLAIAFIAFNNDVNALAVYQSIRPMRKGIAMLASDTNVPDAKGAADVQKAEVESEEGSQQARIADTGLKADSAKEQNQPDVVEQGDQEVNDAWNCDGDCLLPFSNFDNAMICRMGCAYFCPRCYALFLEDKIPFRICNKAHE
jgi:hypothetical protein